MKRSKAGVVTLIVEGVAVRIGWSRETSEGVIREQRAV